MTNVFDLDSSTNSVLNLKLFDNVTNVSDLKQKLLKGALNCCIMKPSLICDPFQVIVAANKAVVAEKLTTKSVYTEILYNLSISKNITQSLIKFGLDDKEKAILVATIKNKTEEDGFDAIFSEILGDEVDLIKLSDFCDLDAVKKAYKISKEELEDMTVLDAVVSRIATKDVILH